MANALVTGKSGSYIGRALVGEAPPAATYVRLQQANVAAPQVTTARELAGYGAIFVAAAALIPSADSIGATNYTVGSQNAAIAEAQPRGRVWGTPAILIPPEVSAQVGRTLAAAPQVFDEASVSVFGTAPPSFDTPIPRTFAVFPQFVDDSSSAVYGTPPPSFDTPVPRTLIAFDPLKVEGYGQLWGPEPEPLVVLDTPVSKTRFAAPEQIDAAVTHVWGKQPDPLIVVDVSIASTRIAAPQQIDFPATHLWGPQPEPLVAGTDSIGAADYSVGHQNAEISSTYRAGRVWGTTPLLIVAPQPDVGKPFTRIAAPEQIDRPFARVLSTPTPLMPVAVVVPGRERPMIFAAPPQIEIGDTWIWSTTVGYLPVPSQRISAVPQIPDQSRAEVWGPTPQTAAAVPRHTVFAAPQTIDRTDSVYQQTPAQLILTAVAPVPPNFIRAVPQYDIAGTALVFWQEPPSADQQIGRTLVAGQFEIDGAAIVFGQQPESVPLDSPVGHTLTAAQFAVDGAAFVFGTTPQLIPASLDRPIGHTLLAGQFEVDGSAAIFGTQPISAEPLHLRSIFAGQYEIDGSGTVFGAQPESASPLYLRAIIAGQYLSDGHAFVSSRPLLAAVVPQLTDVNVYVEAVMKLEFAVARNPLDMDFKVERTMEIRSRVKI